MTLRRDAQVCRVAGLILTNAMIFQEVLATAGLRGAYPREVRHLRETFDASDPLGALADEWDYILREVNYHPIFLVAREVLLTIPAEAETAIRRLKDAALWVTSNKAALRHDLMGRIYHRLLEKAKYLGACYTSIPAATLLLRLAISGDEERERWRNQDFLTRYRVADLACGTGTLLKAALETIEDNAIMVEAEAGRAPDLPSLHAQVLQETLWGFDVVPSAAHLAASALALHEPDVPFHQMRIYHLPLGGSSDKLGSLEFLLDRRLMVQRTLIGAEVGATRVTGGGDAIEGLVLPQLDLCVMNPPFTRSVGGNLLFGSLPEPERGRLQQRLQRVMRDRRVEANSTAGLGTSFVALGDRVLSNGGQLALVLPRALLSGVAWQRTRRLLASGYHVKFLVVSHEPPNAWNFSENTDLSEVLVVARKLNAGQSPGQTTIVNLWKKPRTAFEALALAEVLRHAAPPSLSGSSGVEGLSTDHTTFGEVLCVPPDFIGSESWMYATAFAQTDLTRSTYYLIHGELRPPGTLSATAISMKPLARIVTLGPDRRDIHDGFRETSSPTAYHAFWGHDAATVRTMSQEPNTFLSPRSRRQAGRPFRDPNVLWSRSGDLVIADRLWLKTIRIVAARLPDRVLSNTWWPLRLTLDRDASKRGKALILWLNSTLGLLVLLATRVETRGAWVEFKKPSLSSMPVLDVDSLTTSQLDALASAYDDAATHELRPLAEIMYDDTRIMLDSAIATTCQLPDIRILREMLGREPLVTLQPM